MRVGESFEEIMAKSFHNVVELMSKHGLSCVSYNIYARYTWQWPDQQDWPMSCEIVYISVFPTWCSAELSVSILQSKKVVCFLVLCIS